MNFDELFESFLVEKTDDKYTEYLKELLEKIDFKLYRYVSIKDVSNIAKLPFDNIIRELSREDQYGVRSVLESILYHNKPSFFNDPFDCNFGLGTNAFLHETMQGIADFKGPRKEMQKLDTVNPEDFQKDFIRELSKLDLSKPTEDLLKFITVNTFDALKDSSTDKIDIQKIQRDVCLQLIDNPEYLYSFMRPHYQSEEGLKHFLEAFSSCSEGLKENIDELSSKAVNGVSDLPGMIQIGTKFLDSNELHSALKKAVDVVNEFNSTIFHFINSKFGVSSLTQLFNDPLMWSHYASSHTGFLIEYDFSNYIKYLKEQRMFLYPVIYSDTRVCIDENELKDYDLRSITEKGKNSLTKLFFKGLLTKKTDWKVELEWRSIKVLKGNSDAEIDKSREAISPSISSVYFGNKMPLIVQRALSSLIRSVEKSANLPIYYMKNEICNYALYPEAYKDN